MGGDSVDDLLQLKGVGDKTLLLLNKLNIYTINDLITYSKQHLTTEEALLEKYYYPELAEQKEQHKLFIAKIEEFKEDFRKNHFMLHFNMAIFLKTWISNHIEVLDKKYSQFLNDRGVF